MTFNTVAPWLNPKSEIANQQSQILLTSSLLREICSPVVVLTDTRPADLVARLGASRSALRPLLKNAVLHSRKLPSYRGRNAVFLDSFSVLDPAAHAKSAADPILGHLWAYHADSLPDDFTYTLTRVPEFRQLHGRLEPRGHKWLCPACHQTARILYYPLDPPDWTHYIRYQLPPDEPENLGPLKCFACRKCHGVIFFSRAPAALKKCWNQLILHYTSGLLYGQEVPKPDWLIPTQKRPKKPRQPLKAPLREKILHLLTTTNLSQVEIAQELNLKPKTIRAYACALYKTHQVHTRTELRLAIALTHRK